LHSLIVDTDYDLLDDRRREVDTEGREMIAVADNMGFGKLAERAAVLRPLFAIPVDTGQPTGLDHLLPLDDFDVSKGAQGIVLSHKLRQVCIRTHREIEVYRSPQILHFYLIDDVVELSLVLVVE